ncbi:MAG TPA: acyltransferase family protein [Verrucomicrobiae bacterium]
MTSSPEPTTTRRHDLDALRAVAMLLGIALHAALSFLPGIWVVEDNSSHPVFGLLITAVHGFRMPLFFLISGYFTAMLWRKRGLRELLKQRWQRIGKPCLVGLITIVPLTWAALIFVAAVGKRQTANLETHYWAAVIEGQETKVGIHLSNGTDANVMHPTWGISALSAATMHNRLEVMKLLIQKGADVNLKNRDGGSSLHIASLLGRHDAVKLLLEKGADRNQKNHHGQTAQEILLTDWGKTIVTISAWQVWLDRETVMSGRAKAEAHFVAHGGEKRFSDSGRKKLAEIISLLTLVPFFHHLWFLWFLCWLVGLFAVYAWLAARWQWQGLPAWAVISPARYLWVIPLTLLPQFFMSGMATVFGPDTAIGLLPMPHVLAYYAVFFGFGALYYDREGPADHVGQGWRWTLPVLLVVIFPLGLEMTTGALGFRDRLMSPEWYRPWANILQVVYAWGMSFACMGLFRAKFHGESPRWRYISDSAYWLYLAHLPLMFVAQWLIRDWPGPALVKFTFLCISTTAVLLVSYHYMVRYTWIGRMLNGPREQT